MQRLITIFTILLLIAAIGVYFLPLRGVLSLAGLPESRFSTQKVTGTLWRGKMHGAKLGPFELGDLDSSVRFWPLLRGEFLMDVSRPAAGNDRGLVATIGRPEGNGFLVQDATTRLILERQLAPLPTAIIDLDGVTIGFANGQCQMAQGKIRLSLDAMIPGLDLKNGFSGDVICDGDALILPLQSGSGKERLRVRVQANGFYRARLALANSDRFLTFLLPSLGFLATDDGYAIEIAGQLSKALAE